MTVNPGGAAARYFNPAVWAEQRKTAAAIRDKPGLPEISFRAAWERAGSRERLETSYPILAGGHRYEVDGALPDYGIIIEIDDQRSHFSTPKKMEYHYQRENDIQNAGWPFFKRFTARKAIHEPEWCVRETIKYIEVVKKVMRCASLPCLPSHAASVHLAQPHLAPPRRAPPYLASPAKPSRVRTPCHTKQRRTLPSLAIPDRAIPCRVRTSRTQPYLASPHHSAPGHTMSVTAVTTE